MTDVIEWTGDTEQRLKDLPALAGEAHMIYDRDETRRLDVALLIADHGRSHMSGLYRLHRATKAIYGVAPASLIEDNPYLGFNGWVTECSWIIYAITRWGWMLDADDIGYVEDTVGEVYRDMCRALDIRKAKPVHCPDCGEDMADLGNVMRCPNGHEHMNAGTLWKHWKYHEPMSTLELLEEVPNVNHNTLMTWKKRGQIRPCGTRRPSGRGNYENMWNPWDVISCAFPAVINC